MRFFIVITGALILSHSSLGSSPLMGNYSVVKATCEDFSFVWKKHDRVVFTGEKMVLSGLSESIEESKKCRFEDVYLLKSAQSDLKNGTYHKTAQLAATTRIETCINLDDEFVMASDADKKRMEIPENQILQEIQAQKKGRTITLKIRDRASCDELLEIELTH